MGEKELNFVTLLLPEYISDHAVDLLSSILERSYLCLKAGTCLIGAIAMEKDMSKFSAQRGIHRCCSNSISRGGPFVEKVVLCYRCKRRHIFCENCPYSYTTTKRSGMSLIEEGDSHHRVN